MTGLSRTECRSCGAALEAPFLDLGAMPPSNAYLPMEGGVEQSFPLRLRRCPACLLVQIDHDVPPDILFSDYAYFSSYSDSWLAHAQRFAEAAVGRFGLDAHSFVVELASNDGYLLRNFVAAGIPCLGVEPSDTVAAAARAIGVPTEEMFFGRNTAADILARYRPADLIVANNVLAHVPDLNDFVAGIALLLGKEGVLSVEFPHLATMLEKVAFDTVYHEHYSYFSLLAVERCFERHGLFLFDAERLSTHGGSLRLSAGKTPRPATPGLQSVRDEEAVLRLDTPEPYRAFADKVGAVRTGLLAFLTEAKGAGRRVVGYGAAAKGNTLLNYCGVSEADLPFVADRNPHKQNKRLPGSHIPIVVPERIAEARPDYVLILPWNLEAEVTAQLAFVRGWGGRFVTPIPRLRVK
ncbi:class I SAM-dependent methyltransferase [Oceanibaculum pacificum]|uniref:class I SAM-dependent methyltransferase n=1 Tax=Oceanibaculum pacificum TaxID=580166 RepID=UPI000A64AFF0|nr:class I SAM-dependent methyltransferase [Oceanibaculum pacificum]